MTDMQNIYKLVDALSPEEWDALYQHMLENIPPIPQLRIPGLERGSIWTSKDFDNELPDSFWLGKS